MQRFASLSVAPAQTRHVLRDRFSRFLPVMHNGSIRGKKPLVIKDEHFLQLLLHLDIKPCADYADAQAVYTSALQQGSSEESLDQLIEAGWYRNIYGRLSMPRDVGRGARKRAETAPAFAALMARRFEITYGFQPATELSKEVLDIGDEIQRGARETKDIGSPSPEWIAARLWDRTPKTPATLSASLRVWLDKWEIIGFPGIVPSQVWEESDADVFRTASVEALQSKFDLRDWSGIRALVATQLSLERGGSPSDYEGFLGSEPIALIDRVQWIETNAFEHHMGVLFGELGDAFGLIRLLLLDVEHAEYGVAPHPTFVSVVDLALTRPELLKMLIMHLDHHPVLLADMLLHPPSTILACLIAARWNSHSGAWDRDIQVRDNLQTKLSAFADATSILEDFIRGGKIAPLEVAALLKWFYERVPSSTGGKSPEIPLQIESLRDALRHQTPDYLTEVYEALLVAANSGGPGTATFAAALGIVELGALSSKVDPDPIITAYIAGVRQGQYTLSASAISSSGAAALYELSLRATGSLPKDFLHPLDIRRKLTPSGDPDENRFSIADEVIRSLRAHIRILSRAIAGLDEVPDNIAVALTEAVFSGAIAHEEKSRVAAFSSRFELNPFAVRTDQPIAADLGHALTKLKGQARDKLLKAILEADEPAFLAKLLSYAPPEVRAAIRERISDVTPDKAGSIILLTEAQARIDALLSAGMTEDAAKFIDAERNLKPLGNLPARAFTQFQNMLRLAFARKDWDAIQTAVPPHTLNGILKSQADETIRFFKGNVELSKPDGSRTLAADIFSGLVRAHPYVASYAVNYFAARLGELLSGDLFTQLRGGNAAAGERLLRESVEQMQQARGETDLDKQIFACNEALLLLALGKPQSAIDVLSVLTGGDFDSRRRAYTGVALARLGRPAEALGMLKGASAELGEDEILHAALMHVQTGAAYQAAVSFSAENDPIPRIKAALHDLRNLPSEQQASVFDSSSEPFEQFVIDQVRLATASVVSLVPQMKGIKFDSSEDDLSALVREFLTPRVTPLGWYIPDQSKGGFSAKGNAGERDLMVKRDSATLAVIEAVVRHSGSGNLTLKEHFKKLVCYDTCTLFFHLTYAFLKDIAPVINVLKSSAKDDAPAGFKFLKLEDIPVTDSRPHGFVASYETSTAICKVAFLVLDLAQQKQKDAAAIA